MDCDLCQSGENVRRYENEYGKYSAVAVLYLCDACALLVQDNRYRQKSQRVSLKQRMARK